MHNHFHTHSHSPTTTGATLHHPNFYNFLTQIILLGREQKLRNSIVQLAGIQAQDKVLDVGTGTGKLAITAQRKTGAQVYGVDAAHEMVHKAAHEAAKVGAKVEFSVGVAEALDFPDDTFDVVLNCFVAHHLPGDLKFKAFAEMCRVLKPGGRVFIVDFEPPKKGLSRMILSHLVGNGMLQIDNSYLSPALQHIGFKSVKTGNAGHPYAVYASGVK